MESKRVWPVFIVIFLQILSILVLVPSDRAKLAIEDESDKVVAHFSASGADWVVSHSTALYTELFIETKYQERILGAMVNRSPGDGISYRIWRIGEAILHYIRDRAVTFFCIIYLVILRTYSTLLWLPGVLCILVPAVIDGILGREIAKSNYDYVSPVRQKLSLWAARISLMMTFVIFFVPFPMNPYIVPVTLGLCSLGICFAIRYLHKRI